MTESDIQTAIIKYLREEHGAYVVNIHGGPMQESGIPDILCCLDGLFIGIEVKQPGKTTTPLQDYHLAQIAKANGYAFCAHNVEEVQSGIEAIRGAINTKVSKIIRPMHGY